MLRFLKLLSRLELQTVRYIYILKQRRCLDFLISREDGTVCRKIYEELAGIETAAEKLHVLIDKHFSFLAEDHHLATVTQLELRQSNKDLRLKINDVLKDYLTLIDSILQTGIETGEFSENIDIRLARQMILERLMKLSQHG